MAQDDFYVEAAQRRLNEIEAGRAHATAAPASAKAENDTYSASEAVQLLADLNAQERNLRQLHQQHVASQNPPAPPPPTDSEFMAKSPEKMDYSDVWRVASKSKYGQPDEASFRAGIAEVARRRGRGE